MDSSKAPAHPAPESLQSSHLAPPSSAACAAAPAKKSPAESTPHRPDKTASPTSRRESGSRSPPRRSSPRPTRSSPAETPSWNPPDASAKANSPAPVSAHTSHNIESALGKTSRMSWLGAAGTSQSPHQSPTPPAISRSRNTDPRSTPQKTARPSTQSQTLHTPTPAPDPQT